MTRSFPAAAARDRERRRSAWIVLLPALAALGAFWPDAEARATDNPEPAAIAAADATLLPRANSVASPATPATGAESASESALAETGGRSKTTSALNRLLGLGEGIEIGASGGEEFLDPDVAFVLSAGALGPDAIETRWEIAEGYYIHRDRIRFQAADGSGATLGTAEFPEGKVKDDTYFGPMEVYYDSVAARVPVAGAVVGDTVDVDVDVTYQGCAEAGLCYPPITRTVSLLLPAAGADTGAGRGPGGGPPGLADAAAGSGESGQAPSASRSKK